MDLCTKVHSDKLNTGKISQARDEFFMFTNKGKCVLHLQRQL